MAHSSGSLLYFWQCTIKDFGLYLSSQSCLQNKIFWKIYKLQIFLPEGYLILKSLPKFRILQGYDCILPKRKTTSLYLNFIKI